MAHWLRSRPIETPKKRREIIASASSFFILATFPLFFAIPTLRWIYDLIVHPSWADAGNIALGGIAWLFGLFVMIPLLFMIWPIANAALKYGFAGWCFALATGGLIMALLFSLLNLPHQTAIETVWVSVAGIVFGALYWGGAYRSHAEAFTTPSDSDKNDAQRA
ncbi:MAG: hypothetical protein P8P56_06595 [Yoonia sp.]|nr:hypothetical protein [Yoonia sp.]MDG1861995.1 hypothetical protein [Yoonia sp.]